MIPKIDIIMYLETIFKKNVSNITKEEMLSINSITIELIQSDYMEETFKLLDIIKMFPNLNKVILKNGIISKETLEVLSLVKIDDLGFINCGIQSGLSFQTFTRLKKLIITNCATPNFEFLKTLNNELRTLTIQNPTDETLIDISQISNYTNLRHLTLEKCVVDGIDSLVSFQKLETLSLLWSDVNNIENSNVFHRMSALKELYISSCYYTPSLISKIPQTVRVYQNLNHLTLLKIL